MDNPFGPLVKNIHSELKRIPRWVLWRWEEREGKWTKPPFQPHGAYANSGDPRTWVSFSRAVDASNEGGFSGVGIVLTKEDDLVGVDLDHCLDPTSGEMDSWAKHIVDHLDSYTEITPTGTGLRIFLRGELPPIGRKTGNVEMYV